MILIGKILAWILRNILTIAVITVILCLLAPGIRVAKENASKLTEQREAVQARIQSVEDEIVQSKQALETRLSMLDHWRQQRRECQEQLDNLPSWWHPYDRTTEYIRLKAELERLDIQINTLEAGADKCRETLNALVREKDNLVSRLEEIPKSVYNEFSLEWNKRGIRILLFTICLVLFTPPLWLVFMYYVAAAIVEKFPPIRIRSKCADDAPEPTFHRAARSITFTIPEGRKFYLRAQGGDWGKERRDVTCRTKLMWRWGAPLVSIAADLVELLAYRNAPDAKTPGQIKLTSPKDDEVYIQQIELNGGPGLVLTPRHVIGLTDDIEVRTVWSFKLHNIISMRLRHIVFFGTGTIFIIGGRGIDVQKIEPGSSAIHKIEDGVLVGYVPGAAYSLCRTQTFWAYFRGMTSLLDYKLCGGTFLTQNLVGKQEKEVLGSGLDRFLSVLLNGIGKLLGF
jgi:hypothetical protein